MVMSGKWSCFGSSCGMFECRSIDFEKSSIYEKVASCLPESRFAYEHGTKLIVHRHVEVSLTIALIVISDTMPLLWKGADGFREKCKFFHKKSELSLVCIEELSLHTDKVSEIDELLSKLIGR